MMNLCLLHYVSCFTLKAKGMSAVPLSPALLQPHTLCSLHRLISHSTLEYTFSCNVLKHVCIIEVQGRINVQLLK